MSIILAIPLIFQPMAYGETYKDARGNIFTQDQYDSRVATCQEMINEDVALAKEVSDCKSWALTAIGTSMIGCYIITE